MRIDCVTEEVLIHADGGCLNEALVLRAFDRRRRALATALSGQHGAFAGYDVLDFSETLGSIDSATVKGVLLQDLGERHQVEYQVTVSPDDSRIARSTMTPLVVRAVGWTLTPCRPTSNATGAQLTCEQA